MSTLTALALTILAAILPPCPTEDAANCTWNAAQHGNGTGHSFIDLDGTTIYLDTTAATPTHP
ncbi:MAG: hypothetical protein ACTH32_06605 [Microbacterium gubbeenense]|uniref:hypothetical protein n=1 Tax=Microbacterium gubbeenense TaxID=159896 RepID=UPI003F954870